VVWLGDDFTPPFRTFGPNDMMLAR
jgi:hypothetical protein